ncbi:hypothetical protein K439DRAFT_1070149 [Ramaria rubella]|nr:hypothetical protein K439DRAFT_1070149 [Ramaria rubella]
MSDHHPEWQGYQTYPQNYENYETNGYIYQPQVEGGTLQPIRTYYQDDYESRGQRNGEWWSYYQQPYSEPGYFTEEDHSWYAQSQFHHDPGYGRQTYSPWDSDYYGHFNANNDLGSSFSTYDGQRYQPRHQPRHYRPHPRHQYNIPVVPDPPRAPSPSYLSTSLLSSQHADEPSRKLLVLDLNGTILFRSKPPPLPRSPIPPPSESGDGTLYSNSQRHPTASQPARRDVHTRPYFSCFREYLFHPSTRCWLDVMIWSSAQPHSVKDMLKQCFPVPDKHDGGDGDHDGDVQQNNDEKPDDRFIAVWARDTFGLSTIDYSRKTQTTKDLRKPWSQLPPPLGLDTSSAESSHDETSTQGGSLQPDLKASFRHSAQTTLLLDDSPLKAHLQPWNHVCLKEYDSTARAADMQILRNTKQEAEKEPINETVDTTQSYRFTTLRPTTPCSLGAMDTSPPQFDSTLVAVIGILEAIKHESNVAGWIRARGLWKEENTRKAKLNTAKFVQDTMPQSEGDSMRASVSISPASGFKRSRDSDDCEEASSIPGQPAKRARLEDITSQSDVDNLISVSVDHKSSVLPVRSPKSNVIGADPNVKPVETGGGHVEYDYRKERAASGAVESSTFWFSHERTFAYWVSRGKETLIRLGIDVRHGVLAVGDESEWKIQENVDKP